jgi:glycosyltransferase involved in cell wall biosynthesis
VHEYLREAVACLLAQTHEHLEVIVVNDGSFGPGDQRALDELSALDSRVTVITQENAGPGPARNFGLSQAQGRYVLFFDCDNVAEPTQVERLLDALMHSGPEIGYVGSWNVFIDEQGDRWTEPWGGYQPIGNMCLSLRDNNVAGDTTALFRRELFDSFSWSRDMHSLEDWLLYRQLARAGIYGQVIPERLYRYRKRADSMFYQVGYPLRWRLMEEMEAFMAESSIRWTADQARLGEGRGC